MNILQQISENLQIGKARVVKELVGQAIDEGIPVRQILEEGLLAGMSVIGAKFKKNEVYVPEVLIASRAMNAGAELLKPLFTEYDIAKAGKVIIGTVKGDLHDIGKNLVRMTLEGKGFEVIDLGVDVPAHKFVETAIAENVRIIVCSALLTTTMSEIKSIVEAVEAAGIRDNVTIMIGGAPTSQNFCDSVRADIYTSDATSAAEAAVLVCK